VTASIFSFECLLGLKNPFSKDLWYVLPVHLFAKVRHVKFFPFRRSPISRYEKYREAWCLMACPKDGLCKAEIDIHRRCQRNAVRDESVCPKR